MYKGSEGIEIEESSRSWGYCEEWCLGADDLRL